MSTEDVSERFKVIREDVVAALIDSSIPPQSLEEQWDVPGLEEALEREFGQAMPVQTWLDEDDSLHEEPLRVQIYEKIDAAYREKEDAVGADVMRRFEKEVMLSILDSIWKEHLASMDYLRQGIHLRGYAQKNPKQEYKREAFEMFQGMTDRIKYEVVGLLTKVQVRAPQDVDAIEAQRRAGGSMQTVHDEVDAMADAMAEMDAASVPLPAAAPPRRVAGGGGSAPVTVGGGPAPFVRDGRKVGRNEPCPCGSGKKYKACHGRLS